MAREVSDREARLTLFAGCLVTGALGSVHAFSVLVVPLEARFAASRAEVSLIYSLALVTLTLAVLFGHRLYERHHPIALTAGACLLAAAGLVLAALAPALALVALGFGLLFGGANGLGYGYSLALVSRAWPARRGFAMGTVTACYAVGATLSAKLLDSLVTQLDLTAALLGLAAAIAGTAGAVALVLWAAGSRRPTPDPDQPANAPALPSGPILRLWAGYGLGALAGLMAIGHAAGIVAATGGSADLVVLGAMTIGAGNALGGFLAGGWADRWPGRGLLMALPLGSALCLVALAWVTQPTLAVAGLALVGFAYGAIIAVYPAACAARFGLALAAKAYGRVFTAWGLAGLAGPWLAGFLFDRSGDYRMALLCAAGAGLLSAGAALSFQPAANIRA